MTRLVWDLGTDREYESGLDRGVFYPLNGPGHVWNGLISVEESEEGSEGRARYIDGLRISDNRSRGSFSATVEAFTYPTVVSAGLSSPRRPQLFGFTYRTKTAKGYKLHIVYNAFATPSESNYTHDDTANFSWSISTRAIPFEGTSGVSHLIVESEVAYPQTLKALEDMLYGSEAGDAYLPSPADVLEVFEANSILRITDNGDGTWTAEGPDDVITMLDDHTFQIDWPSATYLDENAYSIQSL